MVYVLEPTIFEGLFPEIMDNLSLFERFYTIVDGVFDLGSIVYLCSVAGVCLFLCVQSMEKRRWSE